MVKVKTKLPKTKKPLVAKAKKLSSTQKYWNQVDQLTHYLVADTLNKILPLPDLKDKQNLDLEKDADYRELFFEYENNYSELDLPSETSAEMIAYEYLLLVVQSIQKKLSEFSCHLGFEY